MLKKCLLLSFLLSFRLIIFQFHISTRMRNLCSHRQTNQIPLSQTGILSADNTLTDMCYSCMPVITLLKQNNTVYFPARSPVTQVSTQRPSMSEDAGRLN